jgi:hypothetical protein
MNIGELVGFIKLDTSGVKSGVNVLGEATAGLKVEFGKMALEGTAAFAALAMGMSNLAQEAAKEQDVMRAFSASFGDASGLKKLQEATKGTIDDFDLMRESNKLAMQGITSNTDQVAKMFEVARARAKAYGTSTTEVFSTMTAGITAGNSRILKQFGVDMPQAFKKSFDSLDLESRRAILFNSIMDASSSAISKTGSNTVSAADKFEQFGASVQNAKDEMGTAFIPVVIALEGALMSVINPIAEFIQNNQKLISILGGVVLGLSAGIAVVGGLGWAITSAIPKLIAFFTTIIEGATMSQLALGAVGIALVALSAVVGGVVVSQMNDQLATLNSNNQAFQNMGDSGINAGNNIAAGMNTASDAVAKLAKEIEKENESYNKQVKSIIDGKQKELEQAKKSMAQELDSFNKTMESEKKAQDRQTEDQKLLNQERLDAIESLSEYTLDKNSSTYQQDLAAHNKAVEEQKKQNDKALSDLTDKQKESTKVIQNEFDTRTSDLKKQISEDEAFLTLHKDEVNRINGMMFDDELTSLKKSHEDRLAEIQAQYSKELGAAQDFNNKMKSINDEAAKHLLDTSLAAVKIIANLGISDKQKWANSFDSGYFNDVWNGTVSQKAVGTNAFKGGMALVGENGPELLSLPTGTTVHNNHDTKNMMQGGNSNITININGNNLSPMQIAQQVKNVLAKSNLTTGFGLSPSYS